MEKLLLVIVVQYNGGAIGQTNEQTKQQKSTTKERKKQIDFMNQTFLPYSQLMVTFCQNVGSRIYALFSRQIRQKICPPTPPLLS